MSRRLLPILSATLTHAQMKLSKVRVRNGCLTRIIFLTTACTLSALCAHLFAFTTRCRGSSCFLRLPYLNWTTSFDSIAQRAFDASHISAEERERERKRVNLTWERGNGGLDDSDRDLLVKTYRAVESVFEFGLGESTPTGCSC